ncbi:unnamed protein product [Clavelina lepadiformis]|uniref:Uncharacterized protein n=1 Tax=Clavelina lepadiformis TaxID=159417 RepID=A0ABP0F741_CLALP
MYQAARGEILEGFQTSPESWRLLMLGDAPSCPLKTIKGLYRFDEHNSEFIEESPKFEDSRHLVVVGVNDSWSLVKSSNKSDVMARFSLVIFSRQLNSHRTFALIEGFFRSSPNQPWSYMMYDVIFDLRHDYLNLTGSGCVEITSENVLNVVDCDETKKFVCQTGNIVLFQKELTHPGVDLFPVTRATLFLRRELDQVLQLGKKSSICCRCVRQRSSEWEDVGSFSLPGLVSIRGQSIQLQPRLFDRFISGILSQNSDFK